MVLNIETCSLIKNIEDLEYLIDIQDVKAQCKSYYLINDYKK